MDLDTAWFFLISHKKRAIQLCWFFFLFSGYRALQLVSKSFLAETTVLRRSLKVCLPVSGTFFIRNSTEKYLDFSAVIFGIPTEYSIIIVYWWFSWMNMQLSMQLSKRTKKPLRVSFNFQVICLHLLDAFICICLHVFTFWFLLGGNDQEFKTQIRNQSRPAVLNSPVSTRRKIVRKSSVSHRILS